MGNFVSESGEQFKANLLDIAIGVLAKMSRGMKPAKSLQAQALSGS